MATSSRKRKASTRILGDATGGARSLPAGVGPSLAQVIRSAGAIEMAYQKIGWSDAHESEALAQEAEWRSRDELTARGWLP